MQGVERSHARQRVTSIEFRRVRGILIHHDGDVRLERRLEPGTRRPYGVLEWPAMLRLLAAEEKNSAFPPYWS